MNIGIFNTLPIYKTLYTEDDNKRVINIYKINNITLTGYNLFYPNTLLKTTNKLLLPLNERTMSLKNETIYEKQNMTYQENSICHNVKSEIKTPVFFFIYNTDNYFHFLYDTLPYLISYFELKKHNPEIKLLMQFPNPQKQEMYRFVLEFLEILNIAKNDIIIADKNTNYNEIYISSSYTHAIDSNLPPRKEIFIFYKKIVDIIRVKYKNIQTPKKIYVSRRTWLHNDLSNIGTNYTTRRKMVNEDELVEKLVLDGYQEVFAEKLTTIKKIQYFSNATHVIGAIGGGIANVLFCNQKTKLRAIISPTFLDVNKRFKFCLDNIDVTYDMNTTHVEKTKFKRYMRVKIIDSNIIGEIEDIYENKLLISYTDSSNVGWNSQNNYNQKEILKNDVVKLDNGLNSHWVYNL